MYRLLAEHSTDMITTHTAEGIYTYVSPASRHVLGYEPEDLLGRSPYELFHPDDLERIQSAHTSLTHGPDLHTIEYRIRRGDGAFAWVESTCKTVRGPEGAIREIICVTRDISDRKAAEEELRRHERMLQAILDNTAAVVYVKQYRGADGAYVLVNRTYERLFNVRRESFLGRNDLALFPRAYAEAFREADRRVFTTGQPIQLEEVAPHEDGPHTYISVKFPLLDDRGRVYAVCGISTDITDRKRAEEAREESWRLARNILDSSPTRIAVLDERGRILHVNRAWRDFAQAAGAGPDGVGEGADYLAVCDRAAAAGLPSARAAAAAIRDVIAGRRDSVSLEYAADSPSGTQWFEAVFTRFAEPGPPRAMVSHADITERKRVEVTLREAVERFNLMVDGAQTGLWDATVVPDDPFNPRNPIYWSPRLKRMLGFEEHEFEDTIGAWSSRLHPDDAPAVFAALEAHLQRREPYDVEYRMIVRSGEVRWFAARGQAIWDEHGRPLRMSGSLSDITDRKRAEERVRRLESEMGHVSRLAVAGKMAAELAHELNQPLAAIAGFAQAAMVHLRRLGAADPAAAEAAGCVRKIDEQARRAGAVIRNMFAFARRREDRRVPASINEVLRDVEPLAAASVRPAGVPLRFELGRGLPRTLMDPIQVQQVVLNLVRNAAESVQRAGPDAAAEPIVVRTGLAPDGCILVAVEDRGVGLDGADVDRLFQAFYTTKSDGVGLGLSISRSIIEAHGGRLWAEPNPAPTRRRARPADAPAFRGAVFRFTLPVVDGDPSHG
jgi:PAS domain S-box-containing protein